MSVATEVVGDAKKKEKKMLSKHLWYSSAIMGHSQHYRVELDYIQIKYKKLTDDAIPPHKEEGNIGWDFHTTVGQEVCLYPGERFKFPTGIALEIPSGYAMMLWDRSGLSSKEGLHRLAGVIDSVYRGEIIVCLTNLGLEPVIVKPGQKIIQGIIQEEIPTKMIEAEDLSETSRGTKGFGSTGN